MQSTFERRCPSLTACGGEMPTGDRRSRTAKFQHCLVRKKSPTEMKRVGNSDRRPVGVGSVHGCKGWNGGVRRSIFVCFTMSARFSAHDFDDDPRSTRISFVDLSSNTPRSRPRSGSVGSEDPVIPQRSSIQINTSLTVRIYTSNLLFHTTDVWVLPSLAPTRKIAPSYDTQARLAAFCICAIIPRTFYFHLCPRDSCRHKSAWKSQLLGSAP